MKKALLVTAALLTTVGCQSTKETENQLASNQLVVDCTFMGDTTKVAPNWICQPDADREIYIRQAVGFSGNTAAGIAHQKNLAILQANKELADQVKTEVLQKIKSKKGTLGVDGLAGGTSVTSAEINAIANVELNGVEMLKSVRGPDSYFYVHLGLPKDSLNQFIEQVIETVEPEKEVTVESNKQLAADIAKAFES